MRSKHILVLTYFIISTSIYSQSNLNKFKYVIVPKKFDFLKNEDQYQMNSITKFLLDKENFTTFFENDILPDDLMQDGCLALTANVIDESGLLKTRLKVQLQDCRNTIVFESRIGDSKLKAYEKAYHQSIREAFQSFGSVNYSYSPKVVKREESTSKKELINQSIKEVKTDSKQALPVLVGTEIKEIKSEKERLDIDLESSQNNNVDILYAQTINNGFQLVDRTPKVVYTIFNSGKKDVYIVKGKDALIYKLDDIWVISEMINESLNTESLNIKF